MGLNAHPDVLLCGGRSVHCSDFGLSKDCIHKGDSFVPAGSYRPLAHPCAVPLALGGPKKECSAVSHGLPFWQGFTSAGISLITSSWPNGTFFIAGKNKLKVMWEKLAGDEQLIKSK